MFLLVKSLKTTILILIGCWGFYSGAENCPRVESAFLNGVAVDSAVEINKKLEVEYDRFFCLDSRLYFDRANYILSSATDPKLKPVIDEFLKKHGLGSYDDKLRLTPGDRRRIVRFKNEFDYRRKRFQDSTRVNLSDKEIVLVTGFMNELFQNSYFNDMVDVLKEEFKVPASSVHVFHTDSSRGADSMAREFQSRIRLVQTNNPTKPIILVGHSRGGLQLLYTFLKYPELIELPSVERIVTIQSPLKGTSTAKAASIVGGLLANICTSCGEIQSGAASMISGHTHYLLQVGLAKLSDIQLALLSRKLFFISSYSNREYTKLGSYLTPDLTDGTVPFDSQYLRSFGRKLAVLPDVGHTDLVLGGVKSSLSTRERRTFARILFETLTLNNIEAEEDSH